MQPIIGFNQPDEIARTVGKKTRNHRPRPPQEAREWMTAGETALVLGCSVATVHRLRRGMVPGVDPLPFLQYGRKIVFRKASITPWQEKNEKKGLR